jgi:predicted PurR-regulated permease PerM
VAIATDAMVRGIDRTNHTPIARTANAAASGIAERGSMSKPPTAREAGTGPGSAPPGDPVSADVTSVSYEPMADVARTSRVRLSLRSSLALVFALGATVLLLEIARDAERVIAWALAAMAIAALVYPAVMWLAHFRFLPRPLAVLLTVVVALSAIGFVGYRIVDDVSKAMTSLQDAAPARAAQLEHDYDFFREINLKERVTKLVDAIPQRLAGGEASQALRSAASRGLAFVAGTILTIFFVLYGTRLVDGGLRLIEDDDARRRAEAVIRRGSRRALFFARVKLWEAFVEGLLAFTIARAAGVPGPAALGVWVALWSILPVAGVMIGALPIVIFAAAHTPQRAAAVAGAFVLIGIGDWQVNRWLERRSVYVGSFAIVLAAFGGLEFYGLTGALLFVLGAILAIAMIREIGPEEVAGVLAATPAPAPEGSGAEDDGGG